MGHQQLFCSLHLAGPDRVAFLGDIEVIHATEVVAEIAQYLSNLLTASPLSQQISEGIYHFTDTIGTGASSTQHPFFPKEYAHEVNLGQRGLDRLGHGQIGWDES